MYINEEGILDEDKNLITTGSVRIGESDVYIELSGNMIEIGSLAIELGFMSILYEGISFDTKEDNYLTYEGIIFKNPEKSVNDESTFKVIVPDEIPEITITIGAESETIGVEPEPTICPEPTDEECKETICDPIIPCPPIEPCKECPEEKCPVIPEGLTGGQIIIFITSLLGVGGIGAFIGKKLTSDRISKIKGVTYRVVVERDGDVREEHRHAGIRSYHSINTSHREAHEKHPRGERYPLYEKDDTGRYVYKGG